MFANTNNDNFWRFTRNVPKIFCRFKKNDKSFLYIEPAMPTKLAV